MNNKEKFGYIYMTTNNINGMKYIGQHKATEFNDTYKGSGDLLRPDLTLYHRNNFSVELIEWCSTQEELDEREKYWISYYNASKSTKFYNVAPGGLNSFKGMKHTEQAKQRMSEQHKKLVTPQFRKQMSDIKYNTNKRKGKAYWVNNGVDEHLVVDEEFKKLLDVDSTYVLGRLPNMIYMYKGDTTIKINENLKEDYIKQGYILGKSKDIHSNIAKSRRHDLWYYKDLEFATSGLLTRYLRTIGYPEITYSTVVNICNGKIVKKYIDLMPHIKRVHSN